MPVVAELPQDWQEVLFVFTSLEHGYEVAELMRNKHSECELFIPEFLSLVPSQTELDVVS